MSPLLTSAQLDINRLVFVHPVPDDVLLVDRAEIAVFAKNTDLRKAPLPDVQVVICNGQRERPFNPPDALVVANTRRFACDPRHFRFQLAPIAPSSNIVCEFLLNIAKETDDRPISVAILQLLLDSNAVLEHKASVKIVIFERKNVVNQGQVSLRIQNAVRRAP